MPSGVVCEYAFTRSGRLRGGNGAGHHGLEDAVRLPVLASDGALHVPGEVVAGVVERDEDALHGEAGVYWPPDPRHGLQEAGHAGCREVLGGDRDEDAVRGGQCVDGDYPQGGRAVDDDVVVVRLDGREPGAHHPLAGHRHEHGHLHGGELDVGGYEVDVLAVAEHPRRGVVSSESGSLHPMDFVRSPWGSASTRSTRLPVLSSATPPRPSAVAVLAVPPFWLATAIVLHVIFLPPICGAAASREARRFRNRNRERGLVALRPSADRPRVRVSPSGTVVPMRNTRLESAGTGLEFPVFLPFRKPIPLRVTE